MEQGSPTEIQTNSRRRLAAIMFTDIVGYTALVQSDETQALDLLERHNRLLRPFFPRYHGREVKTMGDSFLVEFGSALDATLCAIEIQKFLHDYNVSIKDDWKIKLRIGIHLGDVVRKGGDILGDAVNIASRIQPLADPEGVCISEQVFDQVHNKIDLPLEQLEGSLLKNVRFATTVYSVVMPWGKKTAKLLRSTDQFRHELDSRRIAVLPFSNMSPDPNDEYFADGLTEELIDRLCQVSELEVIARTSVMNYKKKDKNVSEIGRELKVGSIVEGSVRKVGNKIRVTAQLVNANTEAHLWSSRYDRNLDDIFVVQSDIAENVVGALKMRLLATEKREGIERSGPSSPAAYMEFLRGLYHLHKLDEQSIRTAILCFEKALKLQPNYAAAMAGLSRCYLSLGYFAYEYSVETNSKGKEFAVEALALDESIPEAHISMGYIAFFIEANWRKAKAEYERSLGLNPSSVDAHINYAWYFAALGHFDQASLEVGRLLELDPLSFSGQLVAGTIYGLARRHSEAMNHFEKTLEMEPDSAIAHNAFGSYLVNVGRIEEGVKELEKALALSNGSIFFKSTLGWAYGVSGNKDGALAILKDLKKASDRMPIGYHLATVCAGFDEREKALDWLEKAYQDHAIIYRPLFIVDPVFAKLRQEPRFKDLTQKLGLDAWLPTES